MNQIKQKNRINQTNTTSMTSMKLTVDIEKKYGDFVLRSNFEVNSERFALLGASGCGKTLTLKCIAGIEKPDRGRITLGDHILYDSEKRINVPAREREIGYLFQNYALFPHMTVKQNIYTVAKDRSYADELMEKFCILFSSNSAFLWSITIDFLKRCER